MDDNLLRRGQLVGAFGTGALVDLPSRSVIIGGLSYWDIKGSTEVHEPRLVAKLRTVLGAPTLRLMTPPGYDDTPGVPPNGVGALVFPNWFISQDTTQTASGYRRQRLLGVAATEKNGLKYRDPADNKLKSLTPVRFVAACTRGHTHDLDWHAYVHRGPSTCGRNLWMETRGTSGEISETWVACDCGQERSMFEATELNLLPLGHCRGTRPWLGPKTREECGLPARLLVRSASNAYFSQIMSVISLPELDDTIAPQLDQIWEVVKEAASAAELDVLRKMVAPVRSALDGLNSDKVFAAIDRRRRGNVDETPVKDAEFEVLASGRTFTGSDAQDSPYYAETVDRAQWDPANSPHLVCIEKLVLVHRLREVIAQAGFTRFEATAPDFHGELDINVERQSLDETVTWLPAVEHRGEGLFLQFSAGKIAEWLGRPAVDDRVEALRQAFGMWATERGSERTFPGGPYIMLHSLSHLLMTAIALECGYPLSSLRERVYAFYPDKYGILIHTGSSDAEGTLGGLVETGRSIGAHIAAALKMAELCSNDPVCAEHAPDNALERRYLHGAACHGCLLISETSCEQRNDLLDRALVVPTVTTPHASFFQPPGD